MTKPRRISEGSIGENPEEQQVFLIAHHSFDRLVERADRAGLEITLTATVRRKDGSRVFKIDAHGEHEVEGEG